MKKHIIIITIIIFIWLSFFVYIVIYGEKVSRDPCSICAEELEEDIVCFKGANKKIFYSTGDVEVIQSESSRSLQSYFR